MARFVMANRRARKTSPAAMRNSREALIRTMTSGFLEGTRVVANNSPEAETARQVVIFEADDEQIQDRIAGLDANVIVEPEMLHHVDPARPSELLRSGRESLSGNVAFGRIRSFDIAVTGNGDKLPNAQVTLYLRSGQTDRVLRGTTSRNGSVRFRFERSYRVAAAVAEPAGGFWAMGVRGPRNRDVVDCPALPSAESYRGWWHRCVGIRRFGRNRGRGIRVGVVDTGLGRHGALSHCRDIGAYIGGKHSRSDGGDVDSHGTHVCGIIGARPTSAADFGGIAPGVRLFSARAFPAGGGANQGDIANAIDALSREHKVDLINLSLGSPRRSEIEQDAIIDAEEHGTLCVCAAANSNGAVEYPAAFEETVAIAAVGLEGWGPVGALASQCLPEERRRFGLDGLYHANFSCFGSQVNGAAPGVGIVSTVPERFGLQSPYAPMDGTSMASPGACAALAVVLSTDKAYRSMPRDGARAERARTRFQSSCRNIGLDPQYQGWGMPQIRG